jgi:glutamate dehydrogenase/leucine dehydrogenase
MCSKVMDMEKTVAEFMETVVNRNPGEEVFHQAVHEVIESLMPVLKMHPEFRDARILRRIVEPERVIIFRVPWVDDQSQVQVNRGFRVEMNSAIGPYKGGLRFHPTVNLGILKFLGFEQVFKNALTTLPIGGGKGGSDFDPKSKSDMEVMRFCQSFMTELYRHIGDRTDIPAGDIGVGAREIGYMFGQYKRIANEFAGILTGKGISWGGSLIRPEATGYGSVYFANEMLKTRGDSIRGKTCLVSGSGNVAQFTAENINRLGGRTVTLSDSDGFIYDKDGINSDKVRWVKQLKNVRRGRIYEYAEHFGCDFFPGKKPWGVGGADCAFPSATQNEISLEDAKSLTANGVYVVCEGANMPTEPEAVQHLIREDVLFGPGKAANAGGVATSCLEMSQNSGHTSWTREEVDQRLLTIMVNIHRVCVETAETYGTPGNYVNGANIAGFLKVANAMLDQGVV